MHNINLRSEPYPFDFVVNDGGGGGGGGGGGRVASSNRASKAMSVKKKIVINMKYLFYVHIKKITVQLLCFYQNVSYIYPGVCYTGPRTV